jgi:tetratricopeptide (TPR) repeat protein
MNITSSDSLVAQSQNNHPTRNSDMRSLSLIEQIEPLDRPTLQQKKSIARIYSEQALIYFREKNWASAIASCQNALQIAPDTADAYKILGNIMQRQGKKAEALGCYAKALEIEPDSAAIYANLGTFYAEQENWQQALDYFQKAVIIDPNLAGAYRSLAQIWEELGEIDKAIESLCQAVNLAPKTLTAEEYFSFGNQLYQQGKIREASIFYTHGVKLSPNAQTELALLIKMLEQLQEWQQAVAYYHQLIRLQQPPGNQALQQQVNKPIRNLLSGCQSKGAISSSPTSVAPQLLAKPKSLAHKNLLASAIKNSGQQDSAVSWNNLGSVYAQKQQWQKAISCYQEALQLNSKCGKTYRNLARVYRQIGHNQKAVDCWYRAFSLEPSIAKAEDHYNLAKGLLQQDQVEKAIICLRRTIQLKPNFNDAYLILGKIFADQGKQQEAQACYLQIAKNSN